MIPALRAARAAAPRASPVHKMFVRTRIDTSHYPQQMIHKDAFKGRYNKSLHMWIIGAFFMVVQVWRHPPFQGKNDDDDDDDDEDDE